MGSSMKTTGPTLIALADTIRSPSRSKGRMTHDLEGQP
jgi:hypothetical protein